MSARRLRKRESTTRIAAVQNGRFCIGMTFLPERFQMHWRGVKQREMSALNMDLSLSLVQPPGWNGHPDLNANIDR